MHKIIYFLLLIVAFVSCDSDEKEPIENSSDTVNGWIYNVMKSNYLWSNEIKEFKYYKIQDKPTDFFQSLLSNNERKTNSNGNSYFYSYIEEKTKTKVSTLPSNTFGIKYVLYLSSNQSNFIARILYTLPNSPAEKEGLRRGMWILTINNSPISSSNSNLLEQGSNVLFGVYQGDYNENMVPTDFIRLSNSIEMYENPIVKDTILTVQNSKIGYLAYTSFLTGPTSFEDKKYEEEMIDVFQKFKSNQVDQFILDLRYNPGGYLTTSRLLSSLLVKKEYLLGQSVSTIYCKLIFNGNRNPNSQTIYFTDDYIDNANLNLSKLYVLTGENTASASEAVINGLAPLMPIIQIGTTTEGKNVGSENYEDSRYEWSLQPIVCFIVNQKDNGDYADGIKPTDGFLFDEFKDRRQFGELGSLSDYPIFLAVQDMGLVSNYSPSSVKTNIRQMPSSTILEPVYSSVQEKSMNSVWIK